MSQSFSQWRRDQEENSQIGLWGRLKSLCSLPSRLDIVEELAKQHYGELKRLISEGTPLVDVPGLAIVIYYEPITLRTGHRVYRSVSILPESKNVSIFIPKKLRGERTVSEFLRKYIRWNPEIVPPLTEEVETYPSPLLLRALFYTSLLPEEDRERIYQIAKELERRAIYHGVKREGRYFREYYLTNPVEVLEILEKYGWPEIKQRLENLLAVIL